MRLLRFGSLPNAPIEENAFHAHRNQEDLADVAEFTEYHLFGRPHKARKNLSRMNLDWEPNSEIPEERERTERLRAGRRAQWDRVGRQEEVSSERLRLNVSSVVQQLPGISVISKFIASIFISLISLANDMFSAQTNNDEWSRIYIYLLCYLAPVYALTIAIVSGANAVLAFARSGRQINIESRARVVTACNRMSWLVLGYGAAFTISVMLMFAELLVFIWAGLERAVVMMVVSTTTPLWAWVMARAYKEWQGEVEWEAGGGGNCLFVGGQEGKMEHNIEMV